MATIQDIRALEEGIYEAVEEYLSAPDDDKPQINIDNNISIYE